MEGTSFGRYRLVELLGRGGMGEVWRAQDTAANNRTVAIKLLPVHLTGDETFVQRFRREAEAAAQLNNPHVIPIHNYGEIDGQLYVDMRLIEGRDLQEVLADGPMEPEGAVAIIEQVAKALQASHKVGLVHRDVKPSNILLDEDDFAYLIDFGIARGVDQTSMTGTGSVIGSWHYMAPERFRGEDIDARADIYALACVLYECLTGTRPFPGDTLESQVAAHLTDPPPRASTAQPRVPTAFDDVIAKGMAKNPGERYSSAAEFAAAARAAIEIPHLREGLPSASTVLGPTVSAPKTRRAVASSRRSRKTKRAVGYGAIITTILVICLAIFLSDFRFHRSAPEGSSVRSGRSTPVPAPSPGDPRGSAATAAEPSHQVEVVSFTQAGDSLSVRLRNPNPDIGLVRAPFELAMLDKAGAVIATEGQNGVPGAPVNTIYQLPPGGEYGLDISRVPSGKVVASLEMTIVAGWFKWDTVNPPTVTVTDEAVVPDSGSLYSGPSVTGRLTLADDGPLNVVVIAFVKTSAGTVVSEQYVDCVRTGQHRSFQTRSFADARGPFGLDKIVAYSTAIKGAGEPPRPNC